MQLTELIMILSYNDFKIRSQKEIIRLYIFACIFFWLKYEVPWKKFLKTIDQDLVIFHSLLADFLLHCERCCPPNYVLSAQSLKTCIYQEKEVTEKFHHIITMYHLRKNQGMDEISLSSLINFSFRPILFLLLLFLVR